MIPSERLKTYEQLHAWQGQMLYQKHITYQKADHVNKNGTSIAIHMYGQEDCRFLDSHGDPNTAQLYFILLETQSVLVNMNIEPSSLNTLFRPPTCQQYELQTA